MKAKDIKGRKFHYEGQDASGSVFLSECTDDEKRVVVRLDKPKSGVPLKMGQEMCQVRPDGSGHFEVNETLFSGLGGNSIAVDDFTDGDDSSSGSGPAMVATDEYRDGWERTFGKNAN